MNNLLAQLAKLDKTKLKAILSEMSPEQLAEIADLVNQIAERSAAPIQAAIDTVGKRKPLAVKSFEASKKSVRRGRKVGSTKKIASTNKAA